MCSVESLSPLCGAVSAYSFLPFLRGISRHHLDPIHAHTNGEIDIFYEGFCSKTRFFVMARFQPHSRLRTPLYFAHSAPHVIWYPLIDIKSWALLISRVTRHWRATRRVALRPDLASALISVVFASQSESERRLLLGGAVQHLCIGPAWKAKISWHCLF